MRIKCRMVMVLLVVGMVSVASAAPTFYEGFNYTMGTENLRGQGPWVSPAVSPHEDFDVYAGSLSYIDGFNNTLATSGNSSGRKSKDPGVGNNRSDVETTLNASTQALFTSTQTIYMSFLLGNGPGGILLRDNINLDGSLLIDGTNDSAGGSMRLRGTGGAGGSGEFGTQLPYGAPARFYVMKIDNVAGGADTVSIIFDPADITTEPSFSFPDITLTFDIKTPDTLFLNAWPDNANYGGGETMSSTGPHIDEIRIGTSWADVAPDGPPQPDPTDFTWAKNDLGSWTDTSNWDPQTVPNNANHTATFGSAATGTTAAVVHSAVTVNRVTFDNTHQYIVGGGGSVNLAATTEGPPVNPAIDVISSDHQFQAIVNLLDDTTVNVASGSTLSFNNELSLLGNTLTKTGAGTLAINNRLTTAGGTVILQEGTISGGGTIGGNVNNNDGTISPGDNLLGAQTVVPELGAQTVVPEPTAALLLGLGLLWVFGLSRSTSRQ